MTSAIAALVAQARERAGARGRCWEGTHQAHHRRTALELAPPKGGFWAAEKARAEMAQAAAIPRAWAMLAAASRFGTSSLR